MHEVANWPAWHLDLLDEFRAKEPDLLERIELLLAQMTAFYVQTHKRENTPAAKVTDYLPCFDAWPDENLSGRYNDVDREVLAALR